MKNMTFSFTQKKVVVTGGASGIGQKIAEKFLHAGAQVAIWDYSATALEKVANEWRQYSTQLHTQQVDITDRKSIEAATTALPWSIEILVNNAGITRDKTFAKMSPEDWDAVINTNLTGLYNVTRGLFEKFDSQSTNKRVINISSVVGLYGNFGQSNYAASKAGVIGMTKTLAKELGKKGFTFNAIAPGFIRTQMTSAMPKEVLEQMANKVPVARLGEVDDIAHSVLFLASEEAAYLNGAVLSVDGGLVI